MSKTISQSPQLSSQLPTEVSLNLIGNVAPRRKNRSILWDHFKIAEDRSKAICMQCNKKVSDSWCHVCMNYPALIERLFSDISWIFWPKIYGQYGHAEAPETHSPRVGHCSPQKYGYQQKERCPVSVLTYFNTLYPLKHLQLFQKYFFILYIL